MIAPIGTPPPRALAVADDVGDDAVVLDGEPVAGPADPGLDLVVDEQDVVLVEDLLDLGATPSAGRCSRPRPSPVRR